MDIRKAVLLFGCLVASLLSLSDSVAQGYLGDSCNACVCSMPQGDSHFYMICPITSQSCLSPIVARGQCSNAPTPTSCVSDDDCGQQGFGGCFLNFSFECISGQIRDLSSPFYIDPYKY